MFAEGNGIRIHYTVAGPEGAPWVTFITGIANDLTMWDGQIPELAGDFRVLRYDSRGHGGTQATDGDYMRMRDQSFTSFTSHAAKSRTRFTRTQPALKARVFCSKSCLSGVSCR